MMMGARRLTNLRWRPFVGFLKLEDWRAGGVHEPAAVAACMGYQVGRWNEKKIYFELAERVPASEH